MRQSLRHLDRTEKSPPIWQTFLHELVVGISAKDVDLVLRLLLPDLLNDSQLYFLRLVLAHRPKALRRFSNKSAHVLGHVFPSTLSLSFSSASRSFLVDFAFVVSGLTRRGVGGFVAADGQELPPFPFSNGVGTHIIRIKLLNDSPGKKPSCAW